ncbi:MAG: 23S rRNA (uracil(1939)-C(5))-methyltransferase RlmD [Christensenellales bacterium]
MDKLMPLNKNDDIELRIDSLGSEGQGVGRYEGMAVFVPFALPNELVKAHIIKVAKNYAVGKLIKVIEPSKVRREPRCSSFTRCGGCNLMHMDYAAQLEYKRGLVENAFARIAKIEGVHVENTIGMDEPYHYRNKAAFPFAMVDGRMCFGFFAPRSHRLIPIDGCFIEQEPLYNVASAVHCWAEENDIQPYDEETGSGTIRHVVSRITTSGDIMAVIVTKGRPKKLNKLVDMLKERCEGIKSIILNRNDVETNVIFGRSYETLWGEDTLTENLCGFEFSVSAASFLQVNPVQTECLYAQVEAFLPEKDGFEAIDVYCGTGTISMILSKRAKHVTGIENIKPAVEDAARNAERNGAGNADFICADAAEALPELIEKGTRPDVIVIDPPRKGCDKAVLNAITGSAVQRVIYVSCDPATLARDVRILVDGGYSIQKVQPIDMFPQTAHVETVCLLSKLNAKQHIEVNLEMDELDLTVAEKKAIYDEIKAYVLEHSGLKVSSLYIAQVKQKCGIIERENYNKPKSEDAKQPQCPPDKEKSIKEALKHFRMI